MSVISEETSKRLGIPAVARGGMARAVGGGGKFEIVYGFLSLLEIGEVKVERVPVYIRRFYDEKDPVDGYLGLAVISRFIALVDYGENMFSLRRSDSGSRKEDSFVFGEGVFSLRRPDERKETTAIPTQPTDALEIPVRTTSSGFLSGEVLLEGVDRPLNFIIDTGASITVVSEKLVEQEDLASLIQPTRMRVFGAAGISEDVKRISLPKVSLGTLVREQVSAAILDLESLNETSGFMQSGILGGNFLRHYRLSLDFQRGLVRLEPIAKTARTRDAGDLENR